MKAPAHVFLGANSGEGFYSLYGQLTGTRLADLLILKAGPGGGKSSFMRAVADRLAEAGEVPVLIHCSGDPDSLDGVVFPGIRAGIVDGTAPHALEPEFTLAHERYVDLTRFCGLAGVKAAEAEIVRRTRAYRAAYRAAYRMLRAAEAVESERRAAVSVDEAKLRRRASGIASRELRGRGEGREDRAFLGGVTHRGDVCRFDTVDALCPRVYVLQDSFGLAAPMLEQLRDAAVAAGEQVLSCPDPDRPQRLQHLLVPGRGLAFVTANDRLVYPGRAYRRVRLDAMAAEGLSRAARARLRLERKLARSLRESAEEALARAKAEHDALEALYNPHVAFDGVYALAEEEAERLKGYLA